MLMRQDISEHGRPVVNLVPAEAKRLARPAARSPVSSSCWMVGQELVLTNGTAKIGWLIGRLVRQSSPQTSVPTSCVPVMSVLIWRNSIHEGQNAQEGKGFPALAQTFIQSKSAYHMGLRHMAGMAP